MSLSGLHVLYEAQRQRGEADARRIAELEAEVKHLEDVSASLGRQLFDVKKRDLSLAEAVREACIRSVGVEMDLTVEAIQAIDLRRVVEGVK